MRHGVSSVMRARRVAPYECRTVRRCFGRRGAGRWRGGCRTTGRARRGTRVGARDDAGRRTGPDAEARPPGRRALRRVPRRQPPDRSSPAPVQVVLRGSAGPGGARGRCSLVNAVWWGLGDVELTGADDGMSHRVTESAYSEGLTNGAGRFTATCGRDVLAAAMVTAPGPACRRCREVARSTGSPGRRRAAHRRTKASK